MEAGLGPLSEELPASSFQLIASSDDNLLHKMDKDIRGDQTKYLFSKLEMFFISLGHHCFSKARAIHTDSPAVQQTSSQSVFASEHAYASLFPAPSVSVSVAECGSPSAPAKQHGIQEGRAMRRNWDQRAGC